MRNSLVCAVVISYNPSLDVLKNIQLSLNQVAHVVVVDNTPQANVSSVLNDLEKLDACTVIRNHKNLGIATALNIGIRYAISKGFPWIMTLDQDSWMRDGYVEEMFSTYQDAVHGIVGMLCPRYEDAGMGSAFSTLRSANGDVVVCITSGSMIQADTFSLIGPMEDDFFIDSVDHEYCLRMRAAGLKVIECPRAILVHSLGRITEHKFLGRTFSTNNHSAKRRYYITRNRLVLMKRYFYKDREWVIADLKRMVYDAVRIFLAEQDKFSKARYIVRAIWDAIFDRLGQRVPL